MCPSHVSTFPASKVNSLRRQASKLSDTQENIGDGWTKSPVDPMQLLAIFRALKIRDGYILRAYQFHAGGNGNGLVWAMPIDAPFPEPGECPTVEGMFAGQPKPVGALDNVMDAIEGNGTPWSYMSASLFAREVAEFGAMWHGCDWSTHTILGADPWMMPCRRLEISPAPDSWKWRRPRPDSWEPTFEQVGSKIVVSFLTHTGLGRERITRFIDTYREGSYRFRTKEQSVAIGLMGFIF